MADIKLSIVIPDDKALRSKELTENEYFDGKPQPQEVIEAFWQDRLALQLRRELMSLNQKAQLAVIPKWSPLTLLRESVIDDPETPKEPEPKPEPEPEPDPEVIEPKDDPLDDPKQEATP